MEISANIHRHGRQSHMELLSLTQMGTLMRYSVGEPVEIGGLGELVDVEVEVAVVVAFARRQGEVEVDECLLVSRA